MIVTLAEAKQYLKLTSVSNDALIQALIDKASAYIQTIVCRDLGIKTYVKLYNGSGDESLVLDHFPIVTVHHLSLDVDFETKVASDILTDAEILVNVNSGIVQLAKDIFPRGKKNIFIRYTAGYSSVPEDIKMACLDLIAKKWQDIDEKRIGVSGKTVMSDNVQFTISDLSRETRDMLKLHKKHGGYETGIDVIGWTVES